MDSIIRLGQKCNFNCLFCNILNNEKVKEHTLEEMKRMVDRAPPGTDFLSLSGGEPTLYPYLDELIEYAAGEGWHVALQTNAVLVDGPRAASLEGAGLGEVFVNFPSHLPETYGELTGAGPGTFEATISGIRALLETGLPVRLNMVINELNRHELVSYVRFVADELPGVEVINFSVIQPHGNARINSHLVPDYGELGGELTRALRVAREEGIRVKNPCCGLPMCMVPGALPLKSSVEYRGGLDARRGGNPGEAFRLVATNKMHAPGCRDCYVRNICLGIWKAYHEIRGDVVEPRHRALRFWPVS